MKKYTDNQFDIFYDVMNNPFFKRDKRMDITGELESIIIDGSMCIVTLIDKGVNFTLLAESKLFIDAIRDAFGEEWHGKRIACKIDTMRLITEFNKESDND